ncbi:MAG: DNA polymerase Y family protein [Gammaproteobacteria bacterium]|nr:DNA polymerase Y family protein [Gammaproteobacteria bacterium]
MAKSPAVLPLPFTLPPEVPQAASQAEVEIPQPLWLALVLPKLALEVHDDHRSDRAAVVVTEYKGRSVVHTVSHLAEIQGVNTNMPINAAYALCPSLKVYPLDEHKQCTRLQQLAHWAGQFTSKVNVQSPQALLLEVRGSLKLFGGLSVIQDRIHQQLEQYWQYSVHTAVTPTPMASLLLANSGQSDVIQNRQQLRSALGRLAVKHLPIELKTKRQLRNTGARLLRDLWRLPKDGLARRFGPKLVNYLDRTLGLIPDPLDCYKSPETFDASYEFPMEVKNTDLLLNIAEQLLLQFTDFLRQRDVCINQCQFALFHDKQAATNIIIGVRQPTRDHVHLKNLLEEHLNRLSLEAPVRSIRLSAKDLMLFSPQQVSLFIEPLLDQALIHNECDIEPLLEQLQARMGRDAIMTFHSIADHRPEYAYRINQNVKEKSFVITQQRPFWLLAEPQLLPQKNHQPWLHGPVTLLKGPERIQAGWWSGDDVKRDYYIAVDNKGSHLWIYQELDKLCRWYLHGLFA